MMVSIFSMILIVVDMILGIGIPVGAIVFLKKKYKVSVKGFFVGCAVMLLFALTLEQIVHTVVLGSPAGTTIQENIFLYAIYGGLMAGLFEETGRFLAMRYVMKREHADAHNALMYGAGHGGFEMFLILTIGMINNLLYSVMINSGQTELLLAPLDEANRGILQSAFDALIQTPSWQFLISPVERMAAFTAQIGFSVIVWAAVTGSRSHRYLLLVAILLHAVLDAAAVFAAGVGLHLVLVEVTVWAIVIGIVFAARKIGNCKDAE